MERAVTAHANIMLVVPSDAVPKQKFCWAALAKSALLVLLFVAGKFHGVLQATRCGRAHSTAG